MLQEFALTDLKIGDWIELFGGLATLAALGWGVHVWVRSKGSLIVTASLVVDRGRYTETANPGEHSRLLRIVATNKGKEPVTIIALGGMTAKPKWHQIFKSRPHFQLDGVAPPLPHTLSPTLSAQWLHNVPVFEQFRLVHAIYVRDSFGKLWCAPRKDARQINSVLSVMRQPA
jgi:hypothetical protein